MERASLDALRRNADLPLAVAAGFGIAALAIFALVVEGRVMPVSLERILAVQQHLAAGAGPVGGVAVLGSSVVVEGIDCAPLAERLPAGTPCANLAWTGGTARQWLLVEPALRASRPRVVVLGLDLLALVVRDEIGRDRLAIAGWWRFVPAAERASFAAALGDEEARLLAAPRALQLLRLRSLPLKALNERARELGRADLRYAGYATNFRDPWIRLSPASPAALDTHLTQIVAQLEAAGEEPDLAAALGPFVEKLRGAAPDTRFLLVLTPIHPRLAERIGAARLDALRGSIAALAARLGAALSDDLLTLPADGFSDAVHPFGAGRTTWSRRVGDAAAALLAD